jgi:calcyclin binding protein
VSIAECKHQIKSNSITITLKKAKDEFWSDLKPKATLLNKKKEGDKKKPKEGEGMNAMMDMMKDMYQNGDENTKKMIAESWTKAQDEKSGKTEKSVHTKVNDFLKDQDKKQ